MRTVSGSPLSAAAVSASQSMPRDGGSAGGRLGGTSTACSDGVALAVLEFDVWESTSGDGAYPGGAVDGVATAGAGSGGGETALGRRSSGLHSSCSRTV